MSNNTFEAGVILVGILLIYNVIIAKDIKSASFKNYFGVEHKTNYTNKEFSKRQILQSYALNSRV